jgi:hypothetical protein
MALHRFGLLRTGRPNSYDVKVLNDRVLMMWPKRHPAKMPLDDRERIERQFTSHGHRINVLLLFEYRWQTC